MEDYTYNFVIDFMVTIDGDTQETGLIGSQNNYNDWLPNTVNATIDKYYRAKYPKSRIAVKILNRRSVDTATYNSAKPKFINIDNTTK